jgi:hypothetical protein
VIWESTIDAQSLVPEAHRKGPELWTGITGTALPERRGVRWRIPDSPGPRGAAAEVGTDFTPPGSGWSAKTHATAHPKDQGCIKD